MDTDDDHKTLHQIHIYSKLGSVRKVKLLLEEEEEEDIISITDSMLDTPLHFAAWGSTEDHVELVKLFINKGANVGARNIHGKTPLHKASRSDSCTIADLLLDHGADIENRGNTGMTPLHDASLVGAAKVAKRLLERGADVNSQDYSGDTPAHMASTYGHISLLKVLLEYGADINLQTSEGLTPLHVACYGGDRNLQVIDLLLESNADLNIKSSRGDTPLHKAVLRSYIYEPNSIYEKLLEKGARIDVRNDEGDTPYDACLVDDNDEEEIVIKTALEKHIVKLKTAGFTVGISLGTDSDELKDFKSECVEELNKMKVTKINELFSLDIVFLRLTNPWFLKSLDTLQKLEEKFRSAEYFKDFPLYGHILINTVQINKRRLYFLENAFVSFNSAKRKQIWSVKLPDLVKFEILDYLSNDDLQHFIESG